MIQGNKTKISKYWTREPDEVQTAVELIFISQYQNGEPKHIKGFTEFEKQETRLEKSCHPELTR